MYCIHPIKDIFNISLSPAFPQDLPWLLGSALYSPFKDLFNICLSPTFPQDLPWLLGSALYSSFSKTYSTFVLSATFLQDLPWLLGCALYSSFQRLIQYLFVTKISTRHVLTDRVCIVFIISKTYSTCVCHQNFHKTCHDCWGLHCCHPLNYLFNICLSPTFLQDWPWLLGSALYSSFSKTYSTFVLSATFLQDLPWLLGCALYSSFQRLIQ